MQPTHSLNTTQSLDRLLKLRLVVGRAGEADHFGWWSTQGVLGNIGESLFRRGFSRTHPWARARVVFEVARQRCLERYPDPKAVTLWNLPAVIEDAFDHRWASWVEALEQWSPFFQKLQNMPTAPLLDNLGDFDLWSPAHAKALNSLLHSGSPGVQLPNQALDDHALTLLAGAFSLGEQGAPIVPWLDLGVEG